MQDVATVRLNDSGEAGVTRIIRGGAIHYSCGQRTTYHSNYAWKIHVGVDAPVWLTDSSGSVDATAGARVVVSPPGVAHSTGAVGLSCAIFVAPGQRSTPWRASSGAFILGGVAAKRIVDACQRFEPAARADTADFVAEVTGMAAKSFGVPHSADARVEKALSRLGDDPNTPLSELAKQVGLSLDRLSRLITLNTGLRLRQHVLWNRLLCVLSSNAAYSNISVAAFGGGFADHAHLTRTFRAFLGRVPSEFRVPPDAIEHW